MTILSTPQHYSLPSSSVAGAVAPAAALSRAWRLGWNLVWPVACAGCGEPDVEICRRCRAVIRGPAFFAEPPGWPPGFGVWTASAYQGVPARLLIAWKERGRHDLTPALAQGLVVALRAARSARPPRSVESACSAGYVGSVGSVGSVEMAQSVGSVGSARSVGMARPRRRDQQAWLLVPVPSSRSARRRRGSDLLGDLVRRAAREARAGWSGPAPQVVPALRHIRPVRDQSELNAGERRVNLSGALAVRGSMAAGLSGRECLVLDDIVTTGTTAAEAARALTSAGALVVGICSLSVTSRHYGVSADG